MRSFAAAAVLLVPLALAGCGDDGSGPQRPEPASISIDESDFEMNDGDTVQINVSVFDQDGEEITDLEDVELFITSQTPTIVSVLPDGRIVALHPGAGVIRAATSDGLIDNVTVTVNPVATSVVIVDGDDQDGLPNQPLPDSVVLRVIDRHNDGVPGVEVQFSVTSGGGSVSPASAVSDEEGLVRVEWTLGPVVGDQAMQAVSASTSTTIPISATISNLVVADVDVPTTVTQGGTLPGTVRIDSNQYTHAIGAAHVVVSWDPAKLQLQAGSLTSGDYARAVRWFDNATGELHLISTDPDVAKGDRAAAALTFDVVGGAGTSTTIDVEIEELIAENFVEVAAGVASDIVVNIN